MKSYLLVPLLLHKEYFVVHVCCHLSSGSTDSYFFPVEKGNIQMPPNNNPILVIWCLSVLFYLVFRDWGSWQMVSIIHRFSVACLSKNRTLAQGSALFGSILVFVGRRASMVSVAAPSLCKRNCRQCLNKQMCLCSNKIYLRTMKFEFYIIIMCNDIISLPLKFSNHFKR